MKKFVTLIGLMLTAMSMAAQTNPQPGYIITNENDISVGTVPSERVDSFRTVPSELTQKFDVI